MVCCDCNLWFWFGFDPAHFPKLFASWTNNLGNLLLSFSSLLVLFWLRFIVFCCISYLGIRGEHSDLRKIVKEEAPPLVEVDEIRVLPKTPEKEAAAPEPEPTTPTQQPAEAHNEMHMEEHFSPDKKGLHPLHEETTPAAVAPAAAPDRSTLDDPDVIVSKSQGTRS